MLGEPLPVEGVERLAALEHHVVRGVDDDVHRPHAGTAQPEAEPERRGLDVDGAHEAGTVVRAQVGSLDAHADVAGGGRPHLARPRPRMAEADAAQRRDLARDAEDRQAVAAVGRHLELEHRGRDPVERRAGNGVGRQEQHPAPIVAERELRLRAEDAGGGHAGEGRDARLLPVRQPGSGQRHRHALPRGEAGRARHDGDRRRVPDIHPTDPEPLRLRMRIDGDESPDPDAGVEPAHLLEALHGKAGQREALGQRLGRSAGDEVREPGQ